MVFTRIVKLPVIAIIAIVTVVIAGRIAANTASNTSVVSETRVAEGFVLSGIDVLEKHNFKALAGRKIGLITNQSGINRAGVSSIELLHVAKNVKFQT